VDRLTLRSALLGGAVVAALLPLIWTLLASLRVLPVDSASSLAWTVAPTLSTYANEIGVAEPRFSQELLTTTGLATAATVAGVSAAFLCAYGVARSRWRGRELLVQGFLIVGSLPVISYAVPLAEIVRRLGLEDNVVGVALAQAAVYAPLAVYVLYGYVRDLPAELEDAARLDGATTTDVVARIALPLCAPGIAATALVVFALNWNSFLLPLTLAAERVKTIPVAMSDFFTFERELEWPTAAAALIASLLPLVALLLVANHVLDRFRLRAAGQFED